VLYNIRGSGIALLLALFSITAPLAGRAAPAETAPVAVSSGTQYQLIGVYDLAKLDHIFGDELQDFMKSSPLPNEFKGRFPAARYPVRLYKVTYASVVPEWNDRPTVASGLVAVPETGQAVMPLVSYQHGTVFDRYDVPSHPDRSMETRIMIARFAAQGYVVIAADYFGRGDSTLPDSYFVKGSAQQATYDMLVAAKSVLKSLGIGVGRQFVSGWSQGGWETMAFLQRLEQDRVHVDAAAIASAPIDVSLCENRWLNNPQPIDAFFLPGVVALEIEAYASYHDVPGFDEFAIQPQYVAPTRDLYAGKIDYATFYARTPHNLTDYTRPEFRATIAAGSGVYWNSIDADQVYRWRQVTPLRNWYGGADEVTPYYIAMLPQQTQAFLGGADTKAIDAGPKADHRAIFVRAVLDQKPWFDSFLTK
jgi:pimeloyl-ACP methyl ester carboxylesterase